MAFFFSFTFVHPKTVMDIDMLQLFLFSPNFLARTRENGQH